MAEINLGDIVRVTKSCYGHTVGTIGEVSCIRNNVAVVRVASGSDESTYYEDHIELVAKVSVREDLKKTKRGGFKWRN